MLAPDMEQPQTVRCNSCQWEQSGWNFAEHDPSVCIFRRNKQLDMFNLTGMYSKLVNQDITSHTEWQHLFSRQIGNLAAVVRFTIPLGIWDTGSHRFALAGWDDSLIFLRLLLTNPLITPESTLRLPAVYPSITFKPIFKSSFKPFFKPIFTLILYLPLNPS